MELIPNKGARIGFIDEDEYQAGLRIVSAVDEILAEGSAAASPTTTSPI